MELYRGNSAKSLGYSLLLVFIPVAVVLLFLGALSVTGSIFIGENDTLAVLLIGYRNWYTAMYYGSIAVIALSVIINVIMIIFRVKSARFDMRNLFAGIAGVFMCAAMVAAYITTFQDVAGDIQKATDDIAALEIGEFIVIRTDALAGTGHMARLPEPLGGNRPNNLRSFQVRDESGDVITILLLEEDYEPVSQLFRETMRAQIDHGNETRNHDIDTVYEFSVTPGFQIVMDVTAIKIGW